MDMICTYLNICIYIYIIYIYIYISCWHLQIWRVSIEDPQSSPWLSPQGFAPIPSPGVGWSSTFRPYLPSSTMPLPQSWPRGDHVAINPREIMEIVENSWSNGILMGFLWDLPSGKGLHNWLVVQCAHLEKYEFVNGKDYPIYIYTHVYIYVYILWKL